VGPLFARHDAAGQARYQELKQLARTQRRVLQGTPGTLKRRSRRGTEYWVREHLRVDGRKDDEHIGTVAAVGERIAEFRGELELAKALAAGSSTLRLLGYQRIERKPAAVLAVFFNHALFRSGLTLVGSHAYGVLLNDLGISAAGYRTQDVDVARAQPLAVAQRETIAFRELLEESGLDFVPVPGLPSAKPSASFKLPGGEALAVDLLVPGERAGKVVPVQELGAHAQTLPYLDFLVDGALQSVVLSPNQVVPVAIPAPQRFALHKLYASQRRGSQQDKTRKDLQQAAVLVAVLEEDTPGLLADALRRLPAAARGVVRRGARAASRLVDRSHPEGQAFLERIASR
jgi:hypothetical protein